MNTIETFPEMYELIDIFESIPDILDKDLDWYYNESTFVLRRDNEILEVIIEPAINRLRLIWRDKKRIRMELDLQEVAGLVITKNNGEESIKVSFNDSLMKDLIVKTKPYISVVWGTLQDIKV
ncbi:hypothetical protein [Viridibacillus arvi]|uniref:Uncharacterized protein n=1 Tax=Viridibacillus arvi TaxID=263475 RepID=A0A0M0LJY1_9BACL|nr:hypothetical protein [Viridibacillus arvi]KOO51301.1 hypothetical protein AMD00_02055 [Viridibacillus arvi]